MLLVHLNEKTRVHTSAPGLQLPTAMYLLNVKHRLVFFSPAFGTPVPVQQMRTNAEKVFVILNLHSLVLK